MECITVGGIGIHRRSWVGARYSEEVTTGRHVDMESILPAVLTTVTAQPGEKQGFFEGLL
jgi:hypothetical protein